jgi:hypothetical protein
VEKGKPYFRRGTAWVEVKPQCLTIKLRVFFKQNAEGVLFEEDTEELCLPNRRGLFHISTVAPDMDKLVQLMRVFGRHVREIVFEF